MADSIRIGRVYGISVELHWTIVILLLISLLLPELFFFFVLVFFSVFLHELSHSVTSLRNGVKVKKIILNPLGGASILDDINIDPKLEFKISIVGPLSNFLIAGVAGIFVTLTPLGTLTQTVQLFFLINVLLAVGNILPIFPMDGGRIFRSYLQQSRPKFDATMLTAKLSKGLLGLIVIGTVAFVVFATGYSLGYRELVLIWDIFIVILLYGGTQAEEQMAVLRREMEGVTVGGALRTKFIYVGSNKSLGALYNEMRYVRDNIIITKVGNSFCYAQLSKARRIKNIASVRDIAVPVPTFTMKTNVVDALASIESNEVPVGVVAKGRKPLGVLTASHLEAFISLHILARKEKAARHNLGQGI